MKDPRLYEHIVLSDKEFPARLSQNHIEDPRIFFPYHWHEHLELHYVLQGEGIIFCNQEQYHLSPGSLVIVNSNELHQGQCTRPVLDTLVLIFDMDDFSMETAGHHLLFQPLIQRDVTIGSLFFSLFQENTCQELGYKISMKGKIYDLIAYLMRNYVVKNLTEQESRHRRKDLERLNQVLDFMETNYQNPAISTLEMAELINLSPGRFAHIFKELTGQSPVSYLNQLRLKKAHTLLRQGELTSTEVAFSVGFSDYNNFGRQFRRQYKIAPSQVPLQGE